MNLTKLYPFICVGIILGIVLAFGIAHIVREDYYAPPTIYATIIVDVADEYVHARQFTKGNKPAMIAWDECPPSQVWEDKLSLTCEDVGIRVVILKRDNVMYTTAVIIQDNLGLCEEQGP